MASGRSLFLPLPVFLLDLALGSSGLLDGGVIQLNSLEERLFNAFPASQDGADGGFADQMGQRHDVAASTSVGILGEGRQTTGLVSMEPQRPFEALDEAAPFGALRDGAVADGGRYQRREAPG